MTLQKEIKSITGNPDPLIYLSTLKADHSIKLLENKKVILLISIGNESCHEQSFISTIDLLKNINCYIKIIVAGTLQRHTIYGMNRVDSLDKAYFLAKELEERWLEQHTPIVRRLPNFEIEVWDTFLQSEHYNYFKNEILELYKQRSTVFEKIEQTAKDFVTRHKKSQNHLEFNDSRLYECTINYLTEELPFIPIWLKAGFKYIIYPGAATTAITELIKYYNHKYIDEYIEWLPISIKNKYLSRIKTTHPTCGYSCGREELISILSDRTFRANSKEIDFQNLEQEIENYFKIIMDKLNILPTDRAEFKKAQLIKGML